MIWIIPSLLSAITQSGYDYFGKKGLQKVDEYTVSFSSFAFAILMITILVYFSGIPATLSTKFFEAVIISGSLNTLAVILYLKSIKMSPLSLSIPMLAFTPALMLITSPLMLNEYPSTFGIVGIVLVTVGAYLLYVNKFGKNIFQPFRDLAKEKGAMIMLLVAGIFSVTANADKIGVLNSNFAFYIFALNIFLSTILGTIMFLKKRKKSMVFVKNIKSLAIVGIFEATTQIFAVIAMTLTIVPYLIAIRRTSIIFSSVFGFVGFNERNIVQRSIAISIMTLGVFLLVLF